MKCPHCKNQVLKGSRLDEGLPVYGCGQCDGALVPLLYYREWAERTGSGLAAEGDLEQTVSLAAENESHKALSCPKCAKLMMKFTISGKTKNRLDFCTSCDEAWLDGGEWDLLKSLELSRLIPSIFTDFWQNNIKKEINEQKLKERFAKILGDKDIEKAEEIRAWIKKHEKRAELLFYINQN